MTPSRIVILALVGLGVAGVREVVAEAGVEIDIEKVTKTREMVAHGVMITPAVVIDEKVVHAGGIPTKKEVERWIQDLQA